MHREFACFWGFGQTDQSKRPFAGLVLEMTDFGRDDGIEVAVHHGAGRQVLFETVLVGPDSRTLLTTGSAETEAFWRCLHTYLDLNFDQHLFLMARCRFNPLSAPIFTNHQSLSEIRNVRFLKLVEEVVDELQTRVPCLTVDVAITHRNPVYAKCINC